MAIGSLGRAELRFRQPGRVRARPSGGIQQGRCELRRHRLLQTFSSSWGSESTAVDTNVTAALTRHVAVTRPDGREQAVVAWATGSTNVHVTIYNGTNWDNGSGSPYADAKVITGVSSVFAAAYEQNSGQLLIAVGSGAQMKYYLWDGSSWVIDGSTQSFASLTQTVQLIRMASKPGAAEIALMATDGTNCVGLIWDGSANTWGSEQKLNTDSVSLHYAAAVTYMQTGTYGGRALFVWDETYTDQSWDYHRLNSREWTGAAWQTGIELYGEHGKFVYRIELAADPSSDDILRRLSIQHRRHRGHGLHRRLQLFRQGDRHRVRQRQLQPPLQRDLRVGFRTQRALPDRLLGRVTAEELAFRLDQQSCRATPRARSARRARTATGSIWHARRTERRFTWSPRTIVDRRRLPDRVTPGTTPAWTSQGNLTTGLLVYLDSGRSSKPFALTLQPPAPALTQAHTRWRNNDGAEAAGTVAVSAYSGAVPANSGSSVTVSHTVSGSNRLLLVGITLGSNTHADSAGHLSDLERDGADLVGAVNHATLALALAH